MARHVFLSFVEEDLDLVNLFRAQASRENSELEFADYSIKEPFDSSSSEYIKAGLREAISKVSVTLCLIGKTTYNSKWVDWEIRKSVELGKGLVGVRLHSSVVDVPPQALTDNNARIVDWNTKEVVTAIEIAAKRAGY